MANPNPNKKGLKVPTSKEARKNGRKGGIKSGEVRKEKKLMSQIYAEVLADENGIDGNGKSISDVVREIINSPYATSLPAKVSLLKELREATEGSKMALTGADGKELQSQGISVNFVTVDKTALLDDEHTQ